MAKRSPAKAAKKKNTKAKVRAPKAAKVSSAKTRRAGPSGGKPREQARASKHDAVDSLRDQASDAVRLLLDQAKEPLSLVETLKEEGLARAGYLLGVAASMASNVTKSGVHNQLRDVARTLGFVPIEEYRDLEARLRAVEAELNGDDMDADEDEEPTEGDDLEEFHPERTRHSKKHEEE